MQIRTIWRHWQDSNRDRLQESRPDHRGSNGRNANPWTNHRTTWSLWRTCPRHRKSIHPGIRNHSDQCHRIISGHPNHAPAIIIIIYSYKRRPHPSPLWITRTICRRLHKRLLWSRRKPHDSFAKTSTSPAEPLFIRTTLVPEDCTAKWPNHHWKFRKHHEIPQKQQPYC